MKEKSFERKTELLDAALKEFTSKSYEDASLNVIIKNAGISKGTFYYHFKDKQALYLFLLESFSGIKWEFINNKILINPELYETGDIFQKFKRQALLAAEFAKDYPQYHKLSRMFSKEQGNPIYTIAISYLGQSTEEVLSVMIDKAIEDGNFKQEYSREFLIKTISFLFSHFDEIFCKEEDYELNRMLENLDVFINFIKYGAGNV